MTEKADSGQSNPDLGDAVNVYVVDQDAEAHTKLMKRWFKALDYKAVVHPYSSQQDGLKAINGLANTVVLCGVTGNGVDAALGGQSWAQYTVEEYIQKIRELSPQARVIVFTGGTFTRDDARKAGADGYLFKTDAFKRTGDRISLVDVVEQALHGTYWQ